jgi:hypothetical protein
LTAAIETNDVEVAEQVIETLADAAANKAIGMYLTPDAPCVGMR